MISGVNNELLLLIGLASLASLGSCVLIKDEYRLEQHLKGLNYSTNIVPILDKKRTQQVFRLAFHPVSLVELNGASQVIKVMGMLSIRWFDQVLVWNQSEFNVSHVHRPPDEIWYPSLYVFNGNSILKPELPISLYHINSSLTMAYVVYKQTFEVNCQMNMSTFPYDTQACKIILVVDYDTDIPPLLRLQDADRNYRAAYFEHSEWRLTDMRSQPENLWFNFYQDSKQTLLHSFVIRMKFQRLGLYYTRNIVIPVTMLTILQILVFVIPIESNEKITFGVTLLLAFTIYMLLFEKLIPKAPTVPAIFSFITSAVVLSAVSVLLSCSVLVVYYLHEDLPMPQSVHWLLFDVLARLLRVRLPPQYRNHRAQAGSAAAGTGPAAVLELNGQELLQSEPSPTLSTVNLQLRHRWRLAAQVLERLLTLLSILCVCGLLGNYYRTLL